MRIPKQKLERLRERSRELQAIAYRQREHHQELNRSARHQFEDMVNSIPPEFQHHAVWLTPAQFLEKSADFQRAFGLPRAAFEALAETIDEVGVAHQRATELYGAHTDFHNSIMGPLEEFARRNK